MIMNKLFLVIIVCFFISCKNNTNNNLNENNFLLTGVIQNVPNNTFVYIGQQNADEYTIVDSILIIDSTFIFSLKCNKNDIYSLRFSNKKYNVYIITDTINKIDLYLDYQKLENYKIQNSKESEKLQIIENKLFEVNLKILDYLNKNQNLNEIDTLKLEYRRFLLNYLSHKDTILVDIFALSQKFITNEPVIPINEFYDVFYSVDKKLKSKFYQNEHYLLFSKFIKNYNIEKLRNNNTNTSIKPTELVDFETKTILNQNFRLANLKGRWILINFWATWCYDCYLNNQIIKRIEKLYPQINIVQISLDSDLKILNDSLNKFNFNHTLINQKDMWGGLIVNLYKVDVLPTNILIDENGKIVFYSSQINDLIPKIDKILK